MSAVQCGVVMATQILGRTAFDVEMHIAYLSHVLLDLLFKSFCMRDFYTHQVLVQA